jgi:hypothetical protein
MRLRLRRLKISTKMIENLPKTFVKIVFRDAKHCKLLRLFALPMQKIKKNCIANANANARKKNLHSRCKK